jgi:hypothetical protein
MGAAAIAVLVVQGIVFALWALAMFSTLFRLLRSAPYNPLDLRGGPGAVLGRMLRNYARLFHDPDFAPDRRRLLVLTPLLFLTILAGALTLRPT